jgi:TRAP-type C4-dicarboxylate transport system substrate-binding protein
VFGLIKKNKITFVFLILLLICTNLVGCAKPAPTSDETSQSKSSEVFELTLAHFQAPTHNVETVLIQGWIKAISEATNGRVKITSFPGGTLLAGTEIYEGVVDGVADIGHSAYAYTRGRFPIIETFLVPGISYNNAKVADWVAMEGIKELNPDELKDVKHFFTWSTGRGDLLMQVPVEKLEDLKGLEIGVTAGQRAEALGLLGATGVVLPMPDHYEAISRGLTKGVLAPMEVLKSYRIGEVTGYVTITPFLYNQLLFMVMNLEKWNSLPPDIQEAIEKVNEQYYKDVVAGFYDGLNKAVIDWIKDDIKITELSTEETKRWKEFLTPMLDQHVASLNSKGLPGQKILDTVLKLSEKYNQTYK